MKNSFLIRQTEIIMCLWQ